MICEQILWKILALYALRLSIVETHITWYVHLAFGGQLPQHVVIHGPRDRVHLSATITRVLCRWQLTSLRDRHILQGGRGGGRVTCIRDTVRGR